MALAIKNVRKNIFDSFTLGPVNVTLEPGNVTVLIGNNGAGKTSLFRMIAGLVKPDSGELDRYPAHNWKAQLAYLPQKPTVMEEFSLHQLEQLQQIAFPEWDEGEFNRLIELFELPREKKLVTLSTGMQKKAVFFHFYLRGTPSYSY